MAKKLMGKVGFHSGSGCYYVRVGGKPKYFPKTIATEEQAEIERAKLMLDLVAAPVNKTADDTTVEVLVSKFLEMKVKRDTQESFNQKKRTLDRFTCIYGQQTIGSITPIDLFKLIEATPIKSNGGGKITVRAALAGFFNWCRCTYRTTNLPHLSKDLEYHSNRRGEDFVFSESEWANLLPHLKNPFYRDILEVCYHTGARPGEIVDAQAAEYDATRKTLQKVHHKTAKKGGVRIILLNDAANEIVAQRLNGRTSGKIFQTTTPPKSVMAKTGTWLKKASIKIGRNPSTVCNYSLRHSFAVRHLNKLVPINIVAKWLGNTVKVCESHYSNTIRQLELAGIRPE